MSEAKREVDPRHLVEAADRIHARLFHDIALMEPDEQDELTDYETKRAALAQALEVTDG